MILRPEGNQTLTSTGSVSAGVGKLIVGAGSLIASMTITFPSTPNDRDNLLIFYYGGVTTLTLSGITLIAGTLPTIATSGSAMCFEYDATNGKWFRLF